MTSFLYGKIKYDNRCNVTPYQGYSASNAKERDYIIARYYELLQKSAPKPPSILDDPNYAYYSAIARTGIDPRTGKKVSPAEIAHAQLQQKILIAAPFVQSIAAGYAFSQQQNAGGKAPKQSSGNHTNRNLDDPPVQQPKDPKTPTPPVVEKPTTNNSNHGPSNVINDSKEGFDSWLNKGTSDNSIYFGVDKNTGEAVYTGITKQGIDKRLRQHIKNGKNFSHLDEQLSGLTRNQARAIEQYLIENGDANTLNKINSISPNNLYYDDAKTWAENYINRGY